MSFAAFADPVIYATPDVRAGYLRKVALLTTVGLLLAGITGFVSAGVFASMDLLNSRLLSAGIVFGAMAVGQYGGRALINSASTATKLAGFALGTVFQGIAMGYILLIAMVLSSATFGSPFVFIAQAMGLTVLTAGGMTLYLMTGPKDLSMLRAGLVMFSLPMLALMVLSWVFPMGGIFGIIISVAFVGMTGAGLLFKLNEVIHTMPASAVVEGAFEITLGVLVLFWNLLSLLMRLQDRR